MQRTGLLLTTCLIAAIAAQPAAAASKAKFYETCNASVTSARTLVPPPPPDIAGTAKKVGQVADVAGKLGGAFGLGGLGGLSKIASTTQQVTKYSDIVGDATAFASKMKQDYPDAASRIAAYGDKMSADADNVIKASADVDSAHDCYQKAFTDLQAGIAAKEVKGRDAKDRQKEIQNGVNDMSSIVADARTSMDANMKSYNDAINGDATGMGLNLGSLVQVAGVAGVTPQAALGLPKVPGVPDDPQSQMQAYQLAAAAQQNGYSANNSQAANMAALARTQGQINVGALPAVPTGAGALGSLSQFQVLASGPTESTAPAGVTPEMMKSLGKAGADSGKYMGAYNGLGAQSEKITALKTAASAKID